MNYLEKFIIEQNKKLEDNIRKALPMPFEEVKDEIIKAKRAQIGEVREWGGVKMRKEANGWVPVKGEAGKPKAEEAPGKEGGETPSIEEHAKKASEAALQNAIKNSPDPEVRAAAHKELQRRTTEEKSEMFQKPVSQAEHNSNLRKEGLDVKEDVQKPNEPVEPKKESKKSSKFKEELHDKIFMVIGNVDANSRKLPKINADAIGKIMDNLDSDNPDYAAASDLLRTVAVNGGNEVFKEGYLDSVADEIDEELGKKEELTKEEKPEYKHINTRETADWRKKETSKDAVLRAIRDLPDGKYGLSISTEGGEKRFLVDKKGDSVDIKSVNKKNYDRETGIDSYTAGQNMGPGGSILDVIRSRDKRPTKDVEEEPTKKIEPKEVDEMMAKYSEGKATVDEVTEFLKKYDAQKKGVKGVDDNIKKSLSEDIVEKRTTYKFLEGQSNLLQKSHINEFVFNDNFSVAKTGLELKKKFEEQLKMEIEEIRENSRKAAECLKEIGEQPTESFEDEYYWVIDGYEDKIQQLPMVFKSGGEIIDMKYSNQERTIQDKKYDYNGLARKVVDGMIEIIHLNTLINSMIDGKTYKLNIKQAAVLGF